MNKFVINKLGFVDFWFYDLQEFDLSEGRLLLRGSNGSGKSVTMQSFIPLVLDGNKMPSRLDPSGSNDKRVENYMLDETREERTSYLYVEFKNSSSYVIIGMGLRAERNKQLDAWYFIINDGRRINIDLFLYEGNTEKIALSKTKLQNRILPSGFFTTKQGEYMRKVNEYIFGYEDPEHYEDLLNLLIQVRAPKISKDFKPTMLYEVLKNSLKLLTEDDLRVISESMQNMDDLRRRQMILRSSIKAALFIESKYDAYNKKILLNKAESFNEVIMVFQNIESKDQRLQSESMQKEEELIATQRNLHEQRAQLELARIKLEDYANSDIGRIMADIETLNIEITRLKRELSEANHSIEKQNHRMRNAHAEKKKQEETIEIKISETETYMEEAEGYAENAGFPHWGHVTIEKLKSMEKAKEILFYSETIKDYENQLKQGITALENKERVKRILRKWEDEAADKLDEKNKIEKELDYMAGLLADCREELKIAFDNWSGKNKFFKLGKNERLNLFQKIVTINESRELISITELLHKYYVAIEREINLSLLHAGNHEKSMQAKIELVKTEIEQLENTTEIEPLRSEGMLRFRAHLKELGIPYVPFYKAFDFTNETDSRTKDLIESACFDMGLLDSLIIAPSYKEDILALMNETDRAEHDKVIFCDTTKWEPDTNYFFQVEGNTNLDTHKLQELISMLLSQESLSFMNSQGFYKHGVITGKADSAYIAKFIGESSRQRFKISKISGLNEMLSDFQQELELLKMATARIQSDLALLEKEKSDMPKYQDIETAINEIDRLSRLLEPVEKALVQLEEKIFISSQEYEKARSDVTSACKDIVLDKSPQTYRDALRDMEQLKETFGEIKSNISSIIGAEQFLLSVENNIENIEQILDDLRYKENGLNKSLIQYQNKLASKEEFIREKETDEVREEIAKYTHINHVYPEQIEKTVREEEALKHDINTIMIRLSELQRDKTVKKIEMEVRNTEFSTEAKYEFVLPFAEIGIEKFCKNIIATYKQECPQTASYYDNALLSAVHNYATELREYNLQISGESVGQNHEDYNSESVSVRSTLTCYLDGKQMPFAYLPRALKAESEEVESMIKESEREIFENILLNTVSDKIRAKVVLSRLWVDKINKIMESKGTAQRLELKLRWEGKKAENEDELNIKKVMEILEDDKKVSGDDIQKLSKHFGSKIKNKVREHEDRGEHPNYQMIVREVLDYRQWYDFKLFANKDNEGMKELTQKNFNQLSVGERAMAMYIPLFAAVNARYDNADRKCPRIVCMDEAFAGISDNNKRILFNLLRDMELEYILNSQELWGTYAEVDSLNIYELFREPSDRFVGISRYHWDGVRRTYVEP